ncbi:MAG: precorrin-2 C(20)-methyltransferase [Thermodesulfobacteriota bacterium]
MSRTNDPEPQARLRGISLGPGAPDLITVRALEALRASDVIYYPETDGGSRALSILRHYGIDGRAEPFHVDMKSRESSESAYAPVRDKLRENLKRGFSVSVVCEGCLSLYSTAFRILCSGFPPGSFELIPGVSSLSAAGCAADVCLGLGSDRIVVIAGSVSASEIRSAADSFETVVVIKPRGASGVAQMIKEGGYEFVYCKDVSGDGQVITQHPEDISDGDLPYFSLFIISKRLNKCRAA